MHASGRCAHARAHTAQLAHSACTCTASGSSEDGRVCRATGQRRPSRKLQRAKSQVAARQGPGQRRPSRMLERTRDSKTSPKNGGHQTVPKPVRKARVTARGVILKTAVGLVPRGGPVLGPPQKKHKRRKKHKKRQQSLPLLPESRTPSTTHQGARVAAAANAA